MKKLTRNGLFWIALFVGVFLLTQEQLLVEWTSGTSFWGLPKWLFWLMGVHILFVFVFHFFSKKYWKG